MSQPEEKLPGGAPVGGESGSFQTSGPIGAGGPGGGGEISSPSAAPMAAGERIGDPEIFSAGEPIGGPANIFNIYGAPIAVLGGVFDHGLPLGGPVTQIFRGGSAPVPNTLFIATISPSGPIAGFLIGSSGSPIGGGTFGGGGLPIGAPSEVQQQIAEIQPRTALVTAPAVVFADQGQ